MASFPQPMLGVVVSHTLGGSDWTWNLFGGEEKLAEGIEPTYCDAVAAAGAVLEHFFPIVRLMNAPGDGASLRNKKNP